MLEVIKELIPLLEGAKDGVVWLVAAYFGVMVLKWVLTCGTILVLAKMTVPFVLALSSGKKINTSWYSVERQPGVRIMFSREEFIELLNAVNPAGGYTHSSDIRKAIKKLKGQET